MINLLIFLACTGSGGAWDTGAMGETWLAMRIDGEDTVFDSAYSQGVGAGIENWGDVRVVSQSFGFVGLSGPSIDVESVVHFADLDYPDDDQLATVFAVGAHPFGTLTNNGDDDAVEVEGVNIHFFDGDGAEWIASVTMGDESGATFTVTSHQPLDELDPTLPALYLTQGTFSCTLFAEDGRTRMIEDGQFRAKTTVQYF
ncbi:MAG: hypothetical protein GXP62_20895 [Oligoflexia bacterium]|nr:hypothetical protein [Oligoflexia bacterium]